MLSTNLLRPVQIPPETVSAPAHDFAVDALLVQSIVAPLAAAAASQTTSQQYSELASQFLVV